MHPRSQSETWATRLLTVANNPSRVPHPRAFCEGWEPRLFTYSFRCAESSKKSRGSHPSQKARRMRHPGSLLGSFQQLAALESFEWSWVLLDVYLDFFSFETEWVHGYPLLRHFGGAGCRIEGPGVPGTDHLSVFNHALRQRPRPGGDIHYPARASLHRHWQCTTHESRRKTPSPRPLLATHS